MTELTALESGRGRPAHLEVLRDVDAYAGALPGLEFNVVRTGRGVGPNVVRTWTGDGLSTASGRIGFPVLGRAAIGDNQVAVAHITGAPPGSRWCEIDLEPGIVLVYGPGADHSAISPIGLGYSYAVVDLSVLEALAEDLQRPLPPLDRGHVGVLAPRPRVEVLTAMEDSVWNPDADLAFTSAFPDALAHAVLRAVSAGRPPPARAERRIDSRRIVSDCIEQLETEREIPSIHAMCRAANVGERRLREAFVSVCGLPPRAYWHTRRLSEARQWLSQADAGTATVERIALDLGFNHLGRFAGSYERLFGEQPSDTLSVPPD